MAKGLPCWSLSLPPRMPALVLPQQDSVAGNGVKCSSIVGRDRVVVQLCQVKDCCFASICTALPLQAP